jgi:hypothetical protein
MRRRSNDTTVQELYDKLGEIIEEGKGDYPARIWHQPTWPFVLSIDKIAINEPDPDDEDADPEDCEILLCQGEQLGYGLSQEKLKYWGE